MTVATISPALVAGAVRSAAAAEKVALDDPTAKALGYVHDAGEVDAGKYTTYKEGNVCSNCQLYAGGEEWGPCAAFGNKLVSANGWCTAWVKAAG